MDGVDQAVVVVVIALAPAARAALFGELALGVVGPFGAFAVGINEFTHPPGGGVVHMGGLAQGIGVAGGATERIVGKSLGVA